MTVSSAGEKRKKEEEEEEEEEEADRSRAIARVRGRTMLAERNSWKFVETRAGRIRMYVRLSTTTDAITKMAVGN